MGDVFVALLGKKNHGNKYILEAFRTRCQIYNN